MQSQAQHLVIEFKSSTQAHSSRFSCNCLSWPLNWAERYLNNLGALLLFLCLRKAGTFFVKPRQGLTELGSWKCLSKSGNTTSPLKSGSNNLCLLNVKRCISLWEKNNCSETAEDKYWARQSAKQEILRLSEHSVYLCAKKGKKIPANCLPFGSIFCEFSQKMNI